MEAHSGALVVDSFGVLVLLRGEVPDSDGCLRHVGVVLSPTDKFGMDWQEREGNGLRLVNGGNLLDVLEHMRLQGADLSTPAPKPIRRDLPIADRMTRIEAENAELRTQLSQLLQRGQSSTSARED